MNMLAQFSDSNPAKNKCNKFIFIRKTCKCEFDMLIRHNVNKYSFLPYGKCNFYLNGRECEH